MLDHRQPDIEGLQILPDLRLTRAQLGLAGLHFLTQPGLAGLDFLTQLGLTGLDFLTQPGLHRPEILAQPGLAGEHVVAQLGLAGEHVVAQLGLAGEHFDPECAQVLPDPRLPGQNQGGEGRERDHDRGQHAELLNLQFLPPPLQLHPPPESRGHRNPDIGPESIAWPPPRRSLRRFT